MRRLGLLLLVGVAACSGTPEIDASVISTINTIGVGEQRILVEFDQDPGDVTATLRDENGSPLDEEHGVVVWLDDDRAIYAFYLEIPEAETYQLTLVAGSETLGPFGFVAVDDPVQVAVGDPSPWDFGEVLLFASLDRCPSGTCGVMADIVDSATKGRYLAFEVFEDPEAEDPVLTSAVLEWGIPGQPWLYVVDSNGIVTAVFEGAVSEDELEEALGSG